MDDQNMNLMDEFLNRDRLIAQMVGNEEYSDSLSFAGQGFFLIEGQRYGFIYSITSNRESIIKGLLPSIHRQWESLQSTFDSSMGFIEEGDGV